MSGSRFADAVEKVSDWEYRIWQNPGKKKKGRMTIDEVTSEQRRKGKKSGRGI